LPPELFERVEVYRGGAPVWLNAGAIGGVIRLVPRREHQTSTTAAIGGGSFETWQLTGAGSVIRPNRTSVRSIALVRGSRGDYPYLDDRGTRLEPRDDIERTRTNADYSEATGLFDLELPLAAGRLHLVTLGLGRVGGFPGPASQPTPRIHRQSTRLLSALSYAVEHAGARLQLIASGTYSRERYTDLYGQLGMSRQTASDDEGLRGFARAAATLAPTDWLTSTLSLGYALDRSAPSDALRRVQLDPSTRSTLSAAFELAATAELGALLVGLRPSARLEWSRTSVAANTRAGAPLQLERALLAPTFRLGAFVEPTPALTLQASAASGVRLPTVFELFGDRGLTLPSPELDPVRSTTFDLGGVLHGRAGPLRGQLELHGFHQARRDPIALFRTAQWQLAHENLSQVKQWGLEAGGHASVGEHLALHAALTQLYTRTALGDRLPFRPQTQLYARPEVRLRVSGGTWSSARAGVELAYRSFAYVDRPNLAYVGACTKLALSASLGFLRDRLGLEARMDDATDARCSDWVGYPLPGRSLFLTLRYEESFDEPA
jgi:iron complex outermembrane receptor protein